MEEEDGHERSWLGKALIDLTRVVGTMTLATFLLKRSTSFYISFIESLGLSVLSMESLVKLVKKIVAFQLVLSYSPGIQV